MNSLKFRVSDKEPERYEKYERLDKLSGETLALVRKSDQFRRNNCTETLQGSAFPAKTQIVSNGFVDTVLTCYNRHHNLVLRPDDIWTALIIQFSFYISQSAETFRRKFVNFEGKRELVVHMGGNLRTASYDLFVKLMSEKIDENLVDPSVKAWALPSFSTTTQDDLVARGVVFMATMKKYFDNKFCMCCGIPNVTLEGTVNDWENILKRLDKLKEYELTWWFDMLAPILEQFILAKMGKPDVEFWQKICNRHAGGSGPSYLSGWITAFCVFDEDGKRQGNYNILRMWNGNIVDPQGPWPIVEIDKIPPGSSQ
ncbi:hypothetical protein Fcan01_00240 [Folsomia candida]|uniref:Uncharacterized protein n=1 Tax=Folsomia candida TaxID=158441 RepID=A0A226EYN7_FOLCA|nr:hypothetical protein Fcan01_00240 [Folsomia candida]